MFNNVWFYILMYVVTGMVALWSEWQHEKIIKRKLEKIQVGLGCMFVDETVFIRVHSRIAFIGLVSLLFLIWPVYIVYICIRREIVYRKIVKEETEKEKWNKQFEEIQKKWLAK